MPDTRIISQVSLQWFLYSLVASQGLSIASLNSFCLCRTVKCKKPSIQSKYISVIKLPHFGLLFCREVLLKSACARIVSQKKRSLRGKSPLQVVRSHKRLACAHGDVSLIHRKFGVYRAFKGCSILLNI